MDELRMFLREALADEELRLALASIPNNDVFIEWVKLIGARKGHSFSEEAIAAAIVAADNVEQFRSLSTERVVAIAGRLGDQFNVTGDGCVRLPGPGNPPPTPDCPVPVTRGGPCKGFALTADDRYRPLFETIVRTPSLQARLVGLAEEAYIEELVAIGQQYDQPISADEIRSLLGRSRADVVPQAPIGSSAEDPPVPGVDELCATLSTLLSNFEKATEFEAIIDREAAIEWIRQQLAVTYAPVSNEQIGQLLVWSHNVTHPKELSIDSIQAVTRKFGDRTTHICTAGAGGGPGPAPDRITRGGPC